MLNNNICSIYAYLQIMQLYLLKLIKRLHRDYKFFELMGGKNHEQSIRRNENQKKHSQIQTGHGAAGHP